MSDGEIVKRDASAFAVCELETNEMRDLMDSNVGEAGLSSWDLDAIKIPTGGGTSFTVPTLEGETKEKGVEGVLIFYRDVRTFWRQSFEESGGGSTPDCASQDGKVGMGDPGGECRLCPMSTFGSDGKGRGQACKQMKKLFVLPPDRLLPFVVDLPPTSLGVVKQYMFRLLSERVPYHGCISRLELEKVNNQDGIAYSRVKLSMVRKLTEAEIPAMKTYRDGVIPALEAEQVNFEQPLVEKEEETIVETEE